MSRVCDRLLFLSITIVKLTGYIKLVNEERVSNGLPEYAVDSTLTALAQERAKELAEKFSHERPDGTSVMDVDYRYSENIYSGQNSASSAMKWWMNSKGHKAAILDSYNVAIGAACYKPESGNACWVLVFSLE